jgi:hypothetical protein
MHDDIDVILVIEDDDDCSDFARLARGLKHLSRKVDRIMTDLTDLRKAVADVQATDTAAVEEITSLAAKVEELTAGNVTQPEIDAIASDLESAATALAAAGPKPPAPPVEEPAPPAEEPAPPAEEPAPPVETPTETPAEPPVEPPVETPGEAPATPPTEGQVPSGTVPADEAGEPSE